MERLSLIQLWKREFGNYSSDKFRQAFKQHAAEHGLAATDLARDLDDAFVLSDGVNQRIKGWSTIGAGEEKIGMRGDPERWFAQAEMFKIKAHERCRISMRL